MTNNTYLVADLFCGAGGSSTGAKNAIAELGGEMDLVAINHWNTAIATHQANHPTARHLVEDVSIVDPEEVVEGGYLDILMASPECKYHSRARGGKPIHDQGRMNPWAVHNWLTKLDVRCVLIENVPEFVDWGPLGLDGKPDKAHRGEHFQAWFMTFNALGYEAQWRMLNAADYGDATTRIRFFLLARKDGNPVRWPEPSHIKGDTGMFPGRQPWRGAREIIDWSNPGRSLLDDPKYRKKPLSEKTRQRIARGLERFGGPLAPLYIRLLDLPTLNKPSSNRHSDNAEAFIVNRHGENGSDRVHPVEEPMPTATTRGAGYLVEAAAEPFVGANRNHNVPKSLEEPIPTATTAPGGGSFLLKPGLEPFVLAHHRGTAPRPTDEPVPTVTTRGPGYLVQPDAEPFILGQQSGGAPRSTGDPAPTVTGDGAISLVRPLVIHYYGQSTGRDVESPLSTITKENKHALTQPTLIEFYGDIRNQDVNKPLTTITQRIKHGLVNPVLVQYNGRSNAANVDEPLLTVTTKDRHGLVNPSLVEVNHGQKVEGVEDSRTHSVEEPLPTLTTRRGTGLVKPTVIEVNHGNGKQGDKGNERRVYSVDEPLGPITTSPGLGLAQPILVQTGHTQANGIHARPTGQPIPTLATKNDITLAMPTTKPYIVPNFGEREGQEPRVHSVEEPIPTVTSRGAGSLVSPVLENLVWQQMLEAGVDLRRLVFVNGDPFLLDIRFRMLQNPELARAMGFDDDESQYEFVGNVSEVTKQIGNAVPVHLAAALVKAALDQSHHD